MKKIFCFLAISTAAWMMAACDSDDMKVIEEPTIIRTNPAPIVYEAEPVTLSMPEKVATDNAFAFSLFKETVKEAGHDKNVFISPLSVGLALSMTLNGATEGSETAEEMKKALQVGGYSMEQVNAHSKEVIDALLHADTAVSIGIAQGIWSRLGFSVKEKFVQANRHFYDAEISCLDFSKPAQAVDTINRWCAEKTNGKIKEAVDELSPSTMMVLANAIYFNGPWMNPFGKGSTIQETFTAAGGKQYNVDMMRQTMDFNYAADDHGRYLEMPYGNGAFNMLLMLPEGSMEDFIDNIDEESIAKLEMGRALVELSLPRFKAECKYELQDGTLHNLGMGRAFGADAEFHEIYEETAPLWIDRVIHKAYIDVHEEGTEAAAVTAILSELGSRNDGGIPTIIPFKVDRPFVFAIRESSTGIILFMGKMETIGDE